MKLDDDLYDYNGKCWRTHQDYECTETMEEILRKNFVGRDFRISIDDEDLLIKYAPILFNTTDKSLEDVMYSLVNKFYHYRHFNDPEWFDNKAKKVKSKAYAKHSGTYKEKALKKKATSMLELLGGGIYNGTASRLVSILNEVIKHPEQFMLHLESMDYPKKHIKDYLISLELQNKTQEINNFINTIN